MSRCLTLQRYTGNINIPSKQQGKKQVLCQPGACVTTHQRGLECSQHCCQACLALKAGDVIILTDDDLSQVAELVGPQDDLTAGTAAAGAHYMQIHSYRAEDGSKKCSNRYVCICILNEAQECDQR